MKRFAVAQYVAAGALLLGVGLSTVACGPSSQSGDTAAKARVSASAADAQLTHDGYTLTHVPGFGKFDIGVSNQDYRYEAVYVVPDKDEKLAQVILQRAQEKLKDGGRAVQLSSTGNLLVAKATTLGDLKNAAKAVAASVK